MPWLLLICGYSLHNLQRRTGASFRDAITRLSPGLLKVHPFHRRVSGGRSVYPRRRGSPTPDPAGNILRQKRGRNGVTLTPAASPPDQGPSLLFGLPSLRMIPASSSVPWPPSLWQGPVPFRFEGPEEGKIVPTSGLSSEVPAPRPHRFQFIEFIFKGSHIECSERVCFEVNPRSVTG